MTLSCARALWLLSVSPQGILWSQLPLVRKREQVHSHYSRVTLEVHCFIFAYVFLFAQYESAPCAILYTTNLWNPNVIYKTMPQTGQFVSRIHPGINCAVSALWIVEALGTCHTRMWLPPHFSLVFRFLHYPVTNNPPIMHDHFLKFYNTQRMAHGIVHCLTTYDVPV